jgi:hypothetical protein
MKRLVMHVQAIERPAFAGDLEVRRLQQVTNPFDATQLVNADAGYCRKGAGGAGCIKDCVATGSGVFCQCDEKAGPCEVLTAADAKKYDEKAKETAAKAAEEAEREERNFLSSPFFFLLLALGGAAVIAAGAMFAGGQGYGDTCLRPAAPKPAETQPGTSISACKLS